MNKLQVRRCHSRLWVGAMWEVNSSGGVQIFVSRDAIFRLLKRGLFSTNFFTGQRFLNISYILINQDDLL